MGNIESVQQSRKGILAVQAGVRQIAIFMSPFGKDAIVKALLGILNDEGHYVVPQAFLQRDQPSDSAVTVLEGISMVKIDRSGRSVRISRTDVLISCLAIVMLFVQWLPVGLISEQRRIVVTDKWSELMPISQIPLSHSYVFSVHHS